jgi:uncharacterized membrane protein YbaN (DUF454 family)
MVRGAVVAGALLPDLATYIFFLLNRFVLGYSQVVIWNTLYFSEHWRPFFDLSHSLIFWPAGAVLAALWGYPLVRWLFASATLHVVLDMLVHVNDAYAHFWPISSWRFESVVSYWDPAHFGNVVGIVDSVAALAIITWFGIYGVRARWARGVLAVLALLYIGSLTGTIWGFVFTL